MVLVNWDDSVGTNGVWVDRDQAEKLQVDPITSIGWVLADTKKHLTIAAHLAGTQVSGEMCIPKCSIRSCKTIRYK